MFKGFKQNLELKWSRYALILSVVQFLVMSISEGYASYMFSSNASAISTDAVESKGPLELRNIKALQVYHILYILAHAFQLLFLIDSIKNQNTISLIAVAIFNISSFIYSIIQQNQFASLDLSSDVNGTWVDSLILTYQIIMCLCIIFTVLSGLVCWKMHKELDWKIYKILGADVALRKLFRWYHFFLLLLKIDLFFYVGFSIQFILLVLVDDNSTENGTISNNGKMAISANATIGFLTALGLYILGQYSSKSESIKLMNLFLAGTLGTVIYFLWKISQILDPSESTRFESVRKSLANFTFMCIVLALTSMAVGSFVKKNFGKGLKTYLNERKETKRNGT
eukprot:NODE_678_length_5296_cov_0.345776.p2 type:complete len:340 gc:universal NODE_678_length_5296_cov_0.345776:4082-5101(+)